MHHHGYLWTGPKQRFDDEALRRPPPPHLPPDGSRPELVQRHREVKAEFPVVDLPPLETAYWLVKPVQLIRGTWDGPKEAAAWFAEQLAQYAPRFDSASDRDRAHLTLLADSAAERLSCGGDVSHGCYLERPVFLSLAVVCCSPNRFAPELPCPSGLPTPSGRRTRRAPRHHQLLPVRARVGQRHPTLTAPDLTEEGDTPVRLLPGVVPVRDSKVTDGPTLVLPAAAWSPFIAAVTAGELTA